MQNKELKSTYYQVYLESFLDSNDDGIGDINGLASKMSILGQVGFNYVFVSKIFGKKDGKTDFSQINPILGDEKAIVNLYWKAKKNRIKIILDFESKDLIESFGQDNFIDEFEKIIKKYHELGIRGLRILEADYLKEIYQADFEKILKSLRQICLDQEILFVGEISDLALIKDDSLLDMVYYSKASDLIEKNSYGKFYKLLDSLQNNIKDKDIHYGLDFTNTSYPRLMDKILGETGDTLALSKALAIMMITMGIVPIFYQGEEIEAKAEYEIDIDKIKDSEIKEAYEKFLESGLSKEEAIEKTKRETNLSSKLPMRWDSTALGGFSKVENYYGDMVNLDNNYKDYLKDADSFIFYLNELIMLRKRESAFGLGDYEKIFLDDSVYVYKKSYKDTSYLILINLTDDFYELDEKISVMMEDGEVILNNNKDYEPEILDAYQALLIKL
ncbi:alpha-amylase family glycosyl hydrolase [uncultured Anaerococcus sp.]|uniref:alpha-amylase family glycosyl hydrolase n=1 Tax=uncultured Anaerococcus sp. TaxID=293428 RepID=UPI0025D820BE|nr:alpha-amylase family glycosyl hydrolase [uncultured Anaerococcus sp.]